MSTTTIATAEIIDMVSNLATINLGYLGIAVTVLVFLGGAFYLFNFKPLKDSIERQEKTLTVLEKDVKENLSSSKEEIKGDLVVFKKTQDDVVLNSIQQRNEKLLSDIQTKIVTFENEFTQKFNAFAEGKDQNLQTIILAEVSNNTRELEKSLNTAIIKVKSGSEEAAATVSKTVSSVQEDLKEVKRTMRKLEVFMYSQKGQMGAIYGSIDLLKDAIDENNWRINGALEDLNKELEGEIITRIEKQLVRLDDKPEYSPLAAKIRKRYQE